MARIKKILCPVGLEEKENNQLASYAADLAKDLGAEIVLLHVMPHFDEYAGAGPLIVSASAFFNESLAEAEEKMKSILWPLVTQGLKASSVIANGDATTGILTAIEEGDYDLVVMSTHGKKGVEGFLFGSVAEKIVKNSPIPVLTMKPE